MSSHLSSAMSEVVIGTIAQLVTGVTAELHPQTLKLKWKDAGSLGSVSFLLPFFLCGAVDHYLLGWGTMASWLACVALGGARWLSCIPR